MTATGPNNSRWWLEGGKFWSGHQKGRHLVQQMAATTHPTNSPGPLSASGCGDLIFFLRSQGTAVFRPVHSSEMDLMTSIHRASVHRKSISWVPLLFFATCFSPWKTGFTENFAREQIFSQQPHEISSSRGHCEPASGLPLAQAELRENGLDVAVGQKTRYPKWNPGKWKHRPKLAVAWWFNVDPYPCGRICGSTPGY